MAKKAKKIHTKKGIELKIVNPDAAGIDIADSEMQVCVPEDRDGDNNRRFGSFTRDLNEICSWLKACKIKTVAMEATGIYWIPLYFKLKDSGIDVILVNAREVKNIAEKKTDEADAEWLMLLHTYGLLKASYQPENEARKIRNLTRHRNNILKALSKEVLHMQKAMEQMNIKLSNVLSDIVGKSGLAIIVAIINGERNPIRLAQLADSRCKRSKEDIALSLEGTWGEDHLFELKQAYDLYKYLQGQMIECDRMIEQLLKSYTALIDTDMVNFKESKKPICKKNAVAFNLEHYGYAIWGVNAMRIPGMSSGSLLQLIGELGHDFFEKFDTPAKFCKWCNLVPNNKISGGKLISSRVSKRKNPVGQVFRLCANTLKDAKNSLGIYFRRIRSRSGHMQAIIATAHKMARIFYTMVKNKSEYDETNVGIDEQELLLKKIERAKITLARLNAKLCVSVI
jgi:transposase